MSLQFGICQPQGRIFSCRRSQSIRRCFRMAQNRTTLTAIVGSAHKGSHHISCPFGVGAEGFYSFGQAFHHLFGGSKRHGVNVPPYIVQPGSDTFCGCLLDFCCCHRSSQFRASTPRSIFGHRHGAMLPALFIAPCEIGIEFFVCRRHPSLHLQ